MQPYESSSSAYEFEDMPCNGGEEADNYPTPGPGSLQSFGELWIPAQGGQRYLVLRVYAFSLWLST